MTRPADLASRMALRRDIFRARVLDAEIAMRLSRCPPPTADDLRWHQAKLRQGIGALRMLEAAVEERAQS